MAPGGLVEVRLSWPGHPRYLKKKKNQTRFIHNFSVDDRYIGDILEFLMIFPSIDYGSLISL